MGVLTQLGIAGPATRSQWSSAVGSGATRPLVRMLVMNLCRVVVRFPFRVVVVVIISTIQALPGQLALMCSGDSFARTSQLVSCPRRFS